MLKIVLGNKNYSSWSLRPWLILKQTGAPFEEVVVPLDQPNTATEIAKYSPSGRVPALLDGDLTVWDSLAICEYLAEKFPQRGLWPADPKARAVARAVSAEMHSGFQALRENHSMNIRASLPVTKVKPEVQKDVERIGKVWAECRKRFGKSGPFLFGDFCIADAMFAPVVTRLRTYAIPVDGNAKAYCDAVWSFGPMQEWAKAAKAEPHTIPKYEVKT